MSQRPPARMTMVTVNYNYGRYLRECMHSIISQPDFDRVDYVVMDGGSTDNSLEIIADLSPHLHYWQSEPDKGNYDAVANGFAKSNAPYMGWLNSDDMLAPWTLRTVLEIFDQLPGVRWITSRFPMIAREDGTVISTEIMPGVDAWGFAHGEHIKTLGRPHNGWITQDATFWRRDLWDEVGGKFDDSLELACDFELWSRFLQHAELYTVPTPLSIYRAHGDNKAIAGREEYRDECVKVLTRFTPNFPEWIKDPTSAGDLRARATGKRFKVIQLKKLLHRLDESHVPPLKTIRYNEVEKRYFVRDE